jgi:hypothetical protein
MGADKSIGVSRRTWERLGRRKLAGESYDDVITRLLDETSPERREPMTDGGERDLLDGIAGRSTRPEGADAFVSELAGQFSRRELKWISQKNAKAENPDRVAEVSDVKIEAYELLLSFAGLKFPSGREDRRAFLRRAAAAALQGDFYGPAPRSDGGPAARQPSLVRRASRNPVVTALLVAVVVLPLLGGGRGAS